MLVLLFFSPLFSSPDTRQHSCVQQVPVPSARYYKLRDFSFNDLSLTDDDTLRACLRMFLDLNIVERFNFDYQTLCRWLLSVKKNYRYSFPHLILCPSTVLLCVFHLSVTLPAFFGIDQISG